MSEPEIYPLPQAAFVLREPVGEVRRMVERRGVQYQLVSLGGRKVRGLDHKTLVFLNWARAHQDDLKPALWQKFYASLRRHAQLPSHIDSGDFRVSLDGAAEQVRTRLATLRELEGQIEHTPEGDAVLRGTAVEVHRIAALLSGGMSIDAVLEDYPSLTADQVTFAQSYAAAHPKPGRPYPKVTAKAVLRQTDFSALDLDDQVLRYLLDTDVISKRNGPNGGNIRRWLADVDDDTLAISVITLFEIARGVQKKRDDGEAALAAALQDGLERLAAAFSDRTLVVGPAVAERWGALAGRDRRHWMDRGLIATAGAHGLILVTCNARDLKGRGVAVIGPDRAPPGRWAPDGTEIRAAAPAGGSGT